MLIQCAQKVEKLLKNKEGVKKYPALKVFILWEILTEKEKNNHFLCIFLGKNGEN